MFRSRLIWQGVSLLALVLIVFTGSIALSGHVAAQEEVDPAGGYADMNNAMGAKMMKAIAATPGHLGSEVARTESGKTVIFSWFEDKESVLDWYYSDYHQQSMEMLFDKALIKILVFLPKIGPKIFEEWPIQQSFLQVMELSLSALLSLPLR